MLCSLHEASELVKEGSPLIVSGNPELIRRLPAGNWIGGSTPFLLTRKGGTSSHDCVMVRKLPPEAKLQSIQRYGVGGLRYLAEDIPDNGFTIIIVPGSTLVHQTFAKEAYTYEGIQKKAIVGWITGVRSGSGFFGRPQAFFGPRRQAIEDEAVAIHMTLPEGIHAKIQVINAFVPGDGDEITFPSEGFSATHATINGETVIFAEYIEKKKIDPRLPLVTRHGKSFINVSIGSRSIEDAKVSFFAPVFRNQVYKFAAEVGDMTEMLQQEVDKHKDHPIFSCTCIGNFIYGIMDGKFDPGNFTGPISFGEIAQVLHNQTFTYLSLEKDGEAP